MNNLKDIHNSRYGNRGAIALFYQDVNEQFEGYTQLRGSLAMTALGCFIRMSMNNLKDIHNTMENDAEGWTVVLSGCQ